MRGDKIVPTDGQELKLSGTTFCLLLRGYMIYPIDCIDNVFPSITWVLNLAIRMSWYHY